MVVVVVVAPPAAREPSSCTGTGRIERNDMPRAPERRRGECEKRGGPLHVALAGSRPSEQPRLLEVTLRTHTDLTLLPHGWIHDEQPHPALHEKGNEQELQ